MIPPALLRVGLDGHRVPVLAEVRRLDAPVLVSANNLWRNKSRKFCATTYLGGLDVELDSGGFVAMLLYGGYRFTVAEYVALVARITPTWWASMDFCCEPEITADGPGTWARQVNTAFYFRACWIEAKRQRVGPPMPVLQGWRPFEYIRCARMLRDEIHWDFWPDLIGLGSVCRRPMYGRNGLLAVVSALDALLPHRFRFHLFGVKGAALRLLAGHPRFGSMDSSAYDAGNRKAHCKANVPRTNVARAAALDGWYSRQRRKAHTNQPTFL